MALAAEQQLKHLGESRAIADHDHDLVHELNARVDSVWKYDQYIANSAGKPHLQQFWKQLRDQDQRVAEELRDLIKKEVKDDCF